MMISRGCSSLLAPAGEHSKEDVQAVKECLVLSSYTTPNTKRFTTLLHNKGQAGATKVSSSDTALQGVKVCLSFH